MPRCEKGVNNLGQTKEEELWAQLRAMRDLRLLEYDKAISQLNRARRNGEDVTEGVALWDAYAKALCDLPEQRGAPWDGGSWGTPWPKRPWPTEGK